MIEGLKRGNAEIVTATREMLDDLATRIKDKDRVEVFSMFLREPHEFLKEQNPEDCFVVTLDGKPSVVFGVKLSCPYENTGAIWMVSDERIDGMQRRFAKHTRTVISYYLEKYNKLFNYVYANNHQSIKWLRFAGAKIGDEIIAGIFNMPFRKFTFERK